jgi:hypothetical protein
MTTPMQAVATATAAVPRLYPRGKVPTSPQWPYGVYDAVLGSGTAYGLDSVAGRRNGAVTVQTFDPTTDGAVAHMEKVTAALLDVALDLPDCTPLRATFDTPRVVRDPDAGGVIGATQQFTFNARKES